MIKDILQTLKIKHYIKNIIVFLPLIFSMTYNNIDNIVRLLYLFVAFCLVSSSVYIMNDLIDIEKDKRHPIKCKRPIASGKISKNIAILLMLILLVTSCIIGYLINNLTLCSILSYFILNVFYSFYLKNVVLIDVSCIAIGFIFRIVGGCFAINVVPSPLVILLTFFTSMFFTFSKRKLEYHLTEDKDNLRKTIKEYTEPLLNQYISINAILSIAFYFTYMLDEATIQRACSEYLYITTIPFTLIIFRLLLKIFTCKSEDDPAEIIYKDKTILILSIFYIILYWLVLNIK